MLDVVTIAGCPSPISRSTAILHYVNQALEAAHLRAETILIRQIPAHNLRFGRQPSPLIRQHCALVKQASGIILGTPMHKGACSEGLQAFLDLLPRHALAGKVVLPVAIAQREEDFFVADAVLRALLAELGASQIVEGVYVQDRHVHLHNRQVYLADPAKGQLDRGIHQLLRELTAQAAGRPLPFSPYTFRAEAYPHLTARAALGS